MFEALFGALPTPLPTERAPDKDPDSERLLTVNFDIVVVASVVVPVLVSDPVFVVLAVILFTKIFVKYPVIEFKILAKKLVEVALVVVEFVMMEFSKTVFVEFKLIIFPVRASTDPVA